MRRASRSNPVTAERARLGPRSVGASPRIRWSGLTWGLSLLVAGMALGVLACWAAGPLANRRWSAASAPAAGITLANAESARPANGASNPRDQACPTVDQLLAMSDEELGRIDPALVNLAVARDLPQYANLDVPRYLRTLDEWAEEIRFDTQRHRYRFVEDPAQFNHSEIEYQITWLASDVNAVFQIDYDVGDFDAADPANLFLTGIVDRKLGTCVSMPLLYVALGWRLGYPIKLVAVPTHLFARWDDGENRVNIEATGYGAELADSFYEQEYFVSPRYRERGVHLASLTPRQMLAAMLLARADYWGQHGRIAEQVADVLRANLLFPDYPLAIASLEDAWTARARRDNYFTSARQDLLAAARKINARARAQASQPVEKVVFTENGPVEVFVDPATGQTIPKVGADSGQSERNKSPSKE